MRVYIPARPDQIPTITSGMWEPPLGFAVTGPLLDLVDSDDDDELAEVVLDVAAWASLEDLGAPLRLVVVAEVSRSESEAAPDVSPAAVRLTGRIPTSAIACAFMDESEAGDDAAGAAAGDEEAADRLAERDLLWYDASEIAHLG
ncbi:DUF6912 family protein [Demequina lignilytica]|uniref:Uncharacterized protein n=1 Tax=Demequina lignilytica TaxID=3051663 RepID=A0AB35MFU8_9MICO|nr:hypothetical protein [Demequina sp. SYSU T0a273]MDN4482633.1 hypothetical protein [Demequina sp. SYSU T0a273]